MSEDRTDRLLIAAAALFGLIATWGLWALFAYWALHGQQVAAAIVVLALAVEELARSWRRSGTRGLQ